MSDLLRETASSGNTRRGSYAACYALIAILHLAQCLCVFPPKEIFSGEPLFTVDYAMHFLDASYVAPRLCEGSFFGYSTRTGAGYATGVLGFLNNKPITFLLAASPARWHPVLFNLAILVALWLPPLLLCAAARRFGSSPGAVLVAGALFLCAWWRSRLALSLWNGGSVLFLDAAALALWLVAVVHERWSRGDPFPLRAILASAVVPWIHPLGVPVAALGLASVWVWSRHRVRRVLEIAGTAAVSVVSNVPWLLSLGDHSRLRGSFDYDLYLAGMPNVVHDFLLGPLRLAPPPGKELAVIGPLVAFVLIGFRHVDRRTFRVLAPFAVTLAVLAYFGTALGLKGTQPYRFAVPLAGVLAILAAPVVLATLRGRVSILLSVIVALLLLSILNRVRPCAHHHAYLGAGLGDTDRWALGALERHAPEGGWQHAGRVLAESMHIVERIPGRPRGRRISYSFGSLERYLSAEFIGSPLFPTLSLQEPASFWLGRLLGRPLESYDPASFAAALDLYDIGFVLTLRSETRARLEALDRRLGLLEEKDNLALFAVDRTPSRVVHGPGRAWSDGETIIFETDRAEPAVLSYHWIPGLVAEPLASVSPAASRSGTVTPFVEVRPTRPGRYRIGLTPFDVHH